MHARTFELAMEKVYAAEEIVDAHCDLFLARLTRDMKREVEALARMARETLAAME